MHGRKPMGSIDAFDASFSGHIVLELVDLVYGAALGELAWEKSLKDIGLAGQFDGLALVAVDRATRQHQTLAAVGLGQCRQTGRALAPPARNPLHTDAVLRSKPGAVWLADDIIAAPLRAETAFATQWMAPQGLVTWGCVCLGSDGEQMILLEVYGRAARGSFGSEAIRLLSRLAPHLSRAWRIGGIDLPGPVGPLAETGDGTTTSAAGLPPCARLRARFGLTKAEARLALHLASGRSLACAAEAFGVRLTTLRSQLGQIYSKTGTNRQVELVALLHRGELASSCAQARRWAATQGRLSA
jgi:DNA-binding CsgD family transcriptional regulator